jgi:hypothetical protein
VSKLKNPLSKEETKIFKTRTLAVKQIQMEILTFKKLRFLIQALKRKK